MKNIITLIATILTLSTFATKKYVVNPGANQDIRANIVTQITAASSSDTVQIPNGIFVLDSVITVNKAITILGGGIGYTTLYRSEAVADTTLENWLDMFYVTADSVKFYGITMKSKIPSTDTTGADGYSIAIDRGIEFDYDTYYLNVSHCRFENFGHSGVMVFHRDTMARGVITQNEFYHNYKGPDAFGYGYGISVFGEGTSWVINPQLGSNNFIFIEDNEFELHRHSVASAGGALMVVRYNAILNNLLGHAVDSHEARGPGNGVNSLGTRAMEVYSNTITNTLGRDGQPLPASGDTVTNVVETAIAAKAGDILVFNNSIMGFRFGILMSGDYVDSTYPWYSQPGYLSGLVYDSLHVGNTGMTVLGDTTDYIIKYGDGDVYYWNNTFTPYVTSPVVSSLVFYNTDPAVAGVHYFVENRDYHRLRKPYYKKYRYPHL